MVSTGETGTTCGRLGRSPIGRRLIAGPGPATLRPHGRPDLRHEEIGRHTQGTALVRRAADPRPLRRPGTACRLTWRAAALRTEVRRAGAARSRREAVPRAGKIGRASCRERAGAG